MLGRYILELSMLDFKLSQFSHSLLAAAVVYSVNKLYKRLPYWSTHM